WAISYSVFSFNLSWSDDTEGFLNNEYLELVAVPGQIGGLVPSVFIPLIIVWLIVLGVLFRSVQKGIEVTKRIMIPTMVVVLMILEALLRGVKKVIEVPNVIIIPSLLVVFIINVLRAVTLDGGIEGLNAFFEPDLGEILSPSVCFDTYGQVFFSLSIALAI